MALVSASYVQQFPSTEINIENVDFIIEVVTACHVARALLWTTYHTPGQSVLYQNVFIACRCDPRLLSYRPWNGAAFASFERFPDFSFSMLSGRQWGSRALARAAADTGVESTQNSDTMDGPDQRTCVPIFVRLAETVIELLAHLWYDVRTHGRTSYN